MKKWLLCLPIALMSAAGKAQLSTMTDAHGYTIYTNAGFVSSSGSLDQSSQPYHDVGSSQDVFASGSFGSISVGSISYSMDSNANGTLSDSQIRSQVELLNLAITVVPGLTITADSIVTASNASIAGGLFAGSETTEVNNLTIDAFGTVSHFDGFIGPDTTLWTNGQIYVDGNPGYVFTGPDTVIAGSYGLEITVGPDSSGVQNEYIGQTAAVMSASSPVPEPCSAMALVLPLAGLYGTRIKRTKK